MQVNRTGTSGHIADSSGSGVFESPSPHRVSSGVLSLYLGAECDQACAFCALKTYQPPRDDGEAELAVLLAHARAARETGVEQVQLEGIDPIRFSCILSLVEQLTELGFAQLTVMGTARRFADPEFRRNFLARAPAEIIVVVPIYGVTAEVHDAISGRSGSFVEARAAVAGLLALRDRVRVALTTVPARQNVNELAQILAMGADLGVEVWGRLPYPLRRAGTDAYHGVAIRELDLIDQFSRSLRGVSAPHRDKVAQSFSKMIAHPCLLYRVSMRAGPALRRVSRHEPWTWQLEGADSNADEGKPRPIATVPCSHVAHCAVADR